LAAFFFLLLVLLLLEMRSTGCSEVELFTGCHESAYPTESSLDANSEGYTAPSW
jgi:hypothetical protein